MDLKESVMSVADNTNNIKNEEISSVSGVTIFTKENCIYCDAAKAVLERAGIVYREIPIGSYPELWKIICLKYGWKGAPLVLMGNKPSAVFPSFVYISEGRAYSTGESAPSKYKTCGVPSRMSLPIVVAGFCVFLRD
ncbi:MAG: glutaredoxin domain-containing protein [Thermodesulfobacteriota bacterium]